MVFVGARDATIAPVDERVEPSGWRVALFSPHRWPGVVLVGGLVLALLAGRQAAWALLIVGLGAAVLERIWPRHAQARLRLGLRTDLLHWLFTNLLQTVCLVVATVICFVVLRPLRLDPAARWFADQPGFVQVGVAYLLVTFGLYWHHRLSHRVPWLWRLHAVHHSSAQLDWAAAARLHPVEFFFLGFFVAPPFVLLGFSPFLLAGLTALTTLWAVLEHANVSWRLRWLDRIYPNIDYHHWHHSRAAEARDTSFGLPLWDTIFGTYFMPKGRRPDAYGLDEAMPDTYVAQLLHPFLPDPDPHVASVPPGVTWAPAGWYPDPWGQPLWRWWDGLAWSMAAVPSAPWPTSPSSTTRTAPPAATPWTRPAPPGAMSRSSST